MTVEIKGKITKKKLEDAIKKARKGSKKKGFDADKYFGIFDWGGKDPVTIQREMRSEWD